MLLSNICEEFHLRIAARSKYIFKMCWQKICLQVKHDCWRDPPVRWGNSEHWKNHQLHIQQSTSSGDPATKEWTQDFYGTEMPVISKYVFKTNVIAFYRKIKWFFQQKKLNVFSKQIQTHCFIIKCSWIFHVLK